MNKKEWKAQYRAIRIIYKATPMYQYRQSDGAARGQDEIAMRMVWEVIEGSGMLSTVCGANPHIIYPIKNSKWAVHHNHRGY